MSIPPTDDDPRRDGVIGNAQDPLPEPWFIRAARGSEPQVQRGPEPGPMVLSAAAVHDAPAVAVREVPTPLSARPTPWRRLAIGAAIVITLIAAVLALLPKQGGAPPVAELAEDGATAALPGAMPLDCASPAAIARLRDVLIGQARAGGARDAALDGRAAGLSVSVAAAPDLSTGDGRTLDCRGTVSLPSVDGAAPVAASVEYRIRPAAGGAIDVSSVAGAAPIVTALARPAPVLAEAVEALPIEDQSELPQSEEPAPAPRVGVVAPPRVAPPAPRAAVAPPARQVAPTPEHEFGRPSFDCRRVTSRVLEAVCSSPRLAALDVEMSDLFFTIRNDADADLRAEIEAGRDEFIARRQSCRNDRCIARAYRERIAELENYR